MTFSWSDAETRLRADRPIIDLDPEGHIREVRFNNRSMAMPVLSPAQTRAFHAAYRRFAAIIARPALLQGCYPDLEGLSSTVGTLGVDR